MEGESNLEEKVNIEDLVLPSNSSDNDDIAAVSPILKEEMILEETQA